jgi:glutathione synthase/RimK-type ligase-like ATP-grasp enzyme
MPDWKFPINWLNPPNAVNTAANKLLCFQALREAEVPTVQWTTEQDKVYEWLHDGHRVFARTVLRGSRGQGIHLVEPLGEVPNAPLYTRNFPKTHEFRVHVAGSQVIDFVEKKAKSDAIVDRAVRNHAGGWVFAHDDLATTSSAFTDMAVSAVDACGLDFAGVDILAILEEGTGTRKVKRAVVCEVNSSPAWQCTETVNAYKRYFQNASL